MSEYFISFDDARRGPLAAAAYIAERIKSSDGHAEAMSAIVPRYLDRGEVDLAAELANTVDDPFTRDKLISLVAEKCAETDDVDYAMQLAEAVEDHGLRGRALERVGLIMAGQGRVEKAIEVAEMLDHPDHILSAAAVQLWRDRRHEEAEALLDRIEFNASAVDGFVEMSTVEQAAGNSDVSIELLERATEVAREIEHNEERIRAFCEIGNHYVQAGRNDLAIGAYELARADAELLDNIHRDPLISASVLGFLHAGSTDLADRALDQVTDKTQIANCLLAFARDEWTKDEKDNAVETLEEAFQILRSQRDIETRDSRARFALLGSIAAQFAGFDKGERGIEIAQTIADENYRTAALSQIATVMTAKADDDHARAALSAIPDDAERGLALISMSDVKERDGAADTALEYLTEAAQLVEEVPQISARSLVYREVAARFESRGHIDRAREISVENIRVINAIRDVSSQAACLAQLADINAGTEAATSEEGIRLVEELLRRSD